MNIYLITRSDEGGYDTYDSAVVVAETEEAARLIHPGGYVRENGKWLKDYFTGVKIGDPDTWIAPEKVLVTLLGTVVGKTMVGDVICASYNAG